MIAARKASKGEVLAHRNRPDRPRRSSPGLGRARPRSVKFALVKLSRTSLGDPLPVLVGEYKDFEGALFALASLSDVSGKFWVEEWTDVRNTHTQRIVQVGNRCLVEAVA